MIWYINFEAVAMFYALCHRIGKHYRLSDPNKSKSTRKSAFTL